MYQIKGINPHNFGKNNHKKIMGVILWKQIKIILKTEENK